MWAIEMGERKGGVHGMSALMEQSDWIMCGDKNVEIMTEGHGL